MFDPKAPLTLWKDHHFTGERALFQAKNLVLEGCRFDDGESPLKESHNIKIDRCDFAWRYPIWYGSDYAVTNCTFNVDVRAGFWYIVDAVFEDCQFACPKGFRRCENLVLKNCGFTEAIETLWWCNNVKAENIRVTGAPYFGLQSNNVEISGFYLEGKYAFDTCENIVIRDAKMLTKDVFWNSKHIRVERCYIEAEYIGWNSEDLTFIDCEIHSHQGFCYIKNLKMVNCRLVDTDLAFEYCENIDIDVTGRIDSIKNPISGRIVCDGYGELIQDDPKVDPSKTEIVVR
ncbi:MAG: DUF3737 family protein [Bacilli bacterium]|nr:DUF3737 family protein [Bacilli bacterium]